MTAPVELAARLLADRTGMAGIPPVHRRWLRPAGDLWEVDPALRARVRVEQANLTGAFPAEPGRCQVVFCRNVLIYLSRAVAESFLTRLAGWLAPGGLVFLGYAETLLPPTRGLRPDVVGGAHVLRADRAGPDAGPPGWRPPAGPGPPDQPPGHPPTAAEMAAAGNLALVQGDPAAAVAALERCDPTAVRADLDGWGADDLAGVLRAKLARQRRNGEGP